MEAFEALWQKANPAFFQQRVFERAKRLAWSALLCLGRHTITGFLTAAGRQFMDWSADYRIFEKERVNMDSLFSVPRQAVIEHLAPEDPLVVLMDDTLLHKRGRKVAGASWWRDPLGPPFHTNFVWGQRFLQISAALPEEAGASQARAIPIDFHHCPTPRKPKKNAPVEEWKNYYKLQEQMKISQQGVDRLQHLRTLLNLNEETSSRRLIVSVDGGYTNHTVFQNIPPQTVLLGRIRKDAKLYELPAPPSAGRGRKASYGASLPTPEAMRKDESIPWQSVKAYAAGKIHEFDVKTIAPVRWRTAGGEKDLRLLIIRPLAYRLSRGSRLLYRDPAFLICTDPQLPLEQFLQFYIWRNEIELNFRDEKTLLGTHQPQVRCAASTKTVPAFLAASYAMLLVALYRTIDAKNAILPLLPKWRKKTGKGRVTTRQAISLLRAQLWGLALDGNNFSPFVDPSACDTKPEKLDKSLHSAAFYATG